MEAGRGRAIGDGLEAGHVVFCGFWAQDDAVDNLLEHKKRCKVVV